jgi:hypothetical protein
MDCGSRPEAENNGDIGPDTCVRRYLLSKATITLQDRIGLLAPSPDNLADEERTHLRDVLRTNHEANMLLLSQLTEGGRRR